MRKLALALLMVVSTTAMAEYPTAEMLTFHDNFNTDSKMLSNLRKGLKVGGFDWQSVMSIHEVADEINVQQQFLAELGLLYRGMRDESDAKRVANLIEIKKKRFATTCEDNLGFLDKSLADIELKDVVRAGQKLRDTLQKTCDYVKTWQ